VRLLDAYGNATAATSAVTVALGANPGGDTLGGTLTVNAIGGVATFTNLVLDQAASGYTLVASSGTAAGATSGTFAVIPGAPAALELLSQPGQATSGEPLAPVPAVRVLDAFGNAVTSGGTTVTLALGSNPAAGTLSGTLTAVTVGGVAEFPGVSLDVAGAGYTVTARSTGLTGATSGAFAVVPGAPAVLVFLAEPTTVQAGAPLPALTVEIRDAQGNRTAATDDVVIGIATAPGAATLGGTRRVAAVAGRAVFADLVLERAGTGYALSALAPGLSAAVTADFDVTPGGAARLGVADLPPSFDVDELTTIDLVAYDAHGNVATGYTGTVHFTSTDRSAVLPHDVTFAAGLAADLGILFRTRGTQEFTLTDVVNAAIGGRVTAAVIGPAVAAQAASSSKSGCGCGTGSPGEMGLLLALGAVLRAVVVPRRRTKR
jgi:hypothetical protein